MRRKLIILSMAAVLGLASCAQEPVQKEIGLQLYSIRNEIGQGLETALDAVAAAGYTFVEMAGYNAQDGTFYGLAGDAFTTLCNSKGLDVISSYQWTRSQCSNLGRMHGLVGQSHPGPPHCRRSIHRSAFHVEECLRIC